MATSRPTKARSSLRDTVRENVNKMLIYKYGNRSHREWVKASGISMGTLGRALRGEAGLNLTTLEEVAAGVGLMPYQLLIEIEEPHNPPVVPGAFSDERKLYKKFLELKESLSEA